MKLVTQKGVVAPDIFKHRWQRPEAKAKTIHININNVEILFEEKRLAWVGLQAAHTYLGLWEMFGPARGFVAARRASLGKISKY